MPLNYPTVGIGSDREPAYFALETYLPRERVAIAI